MKRLGILAAVYLLLSVAGGIAVADRAVHRPVRRALTADDHASASALARTSDASLESVAVSARDGAAMRGWTLTPRRHDGRSVVLLHGITSNRAAMTDAAAMFLDAGVRTLAPDLRAHGESEGLFGVSGTQEADDLRQWVAWLRRDRADGCVYLFGASLGAGLAVQAADTPGVCAVVAVSAFISVRETTFDRIGSRFGTGPWLGRTLLRLAVESGLLYTRVRYGPDPGAASAVRSAARATVPILLIHGTADRNVPVRHAHGIHAGNPERVLLWLVDGGTHEDTRHVAGAEFTRRVLGFLAAAPPAPF